MVKVVSDQDARQGRRGRQVLIVLVCSLLLALVAWAGVEIWGEQLDGGAQETPGQVSP